MPAPVDQTEMEAQAIAAVSAAPAAAPQWDRGGFPAFLRRRPRFLLGYCLVLAVTAIGLLSPWLAPHSPVDADSAAYLLSPNLAHPMGTDAAGLDVLSRVMAAPRVDLTIALVSTCLAAGVGSVLGAFIGLWEGAGRLKSAGAGFGLRVSDVVQAFPVFALALVLVAVLGQGVHSIVLAIGSVNIPVYLRITRSQTLGLRNVPFVEAARIGGAGDVYVLKRHIAPNAAPIVLAQMAVGVGTAIMLTAGLSFIGAGVRAPTPEWGAMIASGFQNVVTGQWWPALFPGVALALTALGFSLVGASLEAWSNPRERTKPSRREWLAFLAGSRAARAQK
jgi:peptide/nickel transport system permease protein